MLNKNGNYLFKNPKTLSTVDLINYSTFNRQADKKEEKSVTHSSNDDISNDSRLPLLKAMILSLASGILFATSSYLAKRLDEFPSATLTSYILLFYLSSGIPLSVSRWKEVIFDLRDLFKKVFPMCFMTVVAMFLWLVAMRRLSLFDANVIIVSYPIFATILSRIFLKEACSILQVTAIFMTCLGLCLLTKIPWMASDPSSPLASMDMGGVGMAFLCTAAYVVLVVVSRHCLQGFNYQANQIYLPIMGFPFVILMIWLLDGQPRLPYCGIESVTVVVLAVTVVLGSFSLSLALQLGEVGFVSVARSAADVIFTFFFQVVVVGEPPDLLSILGGVFVLSSVFLYGLKPSLLKLVQKSERMRKFEFFF